MRTSFGIALVVALFVMTSGAWAGNVSITVPNGSFELPAGCLAACGTATDWTVYNSGVFEPIASVYATIPDGVQVAWANNGGSLEQTDLGTFAANTTYTLTVYVGARAGDPFGGEIYLLGNSADVDSYIGTTPATGTFTPWTITFNTATDPGVVGENIGIELYSSTIQSDFDDVQLSDNGGNGGGGTVPEPAMFALVGAGLLGLVTRRRFAK